MAAMAGTLDGQLASNRNCGKPPERDVLASPFAVLPTKMQKLWKPVRHT